MGKVFKDLVDLHRTYTRQVTGQRYVKKKEQREAEAVRLKEFLYVGPPRKNTIRSTLFTALLLQGEKFLGVEICEAWESQDFYRYATAFEEKNSVLCTHANMLSNFAVESGLAGQPFMPIVHDTGDLDVYVAGHIGVVMGDRLVTPNLLSRRSGGTPELALSRGVPFFVVAQGANAPDGWGFISAPDIRYQVIVKPNGRVTQLEKVGSRSLTSANWVIDFVVAPAMLALAKSGTRMALSIMERISVGKAPQVLAGPSRELAKEAAAAQSAKIAAARDKVYNELALAKTPYAGREAARSTMPVGVRGGNTAASSAGHTPGAAIVDPRKAAQNARQDAFWRELNAEYEAAGSRFTRDQLNSVVDRLEKKHGVDMLDW